MILLAWLGGYCNLTQVATFKKKRAETEFLLENRVLSVQKASQNDRFRAKQRKTRFLVHRWQLRLLKKKSATEETPFGSDALVFKVMGK
ncbi:MAG: hypothetical protein B5M51_01630, partial [Anaerolinea sp. 4484_236]